MGSANSSSKGADQKSKTDIIPYQSLSNPFFRKDWNVLKFYYFSQKPTQEKTAHLHSAAELTSIILGCYEQLMNISDILEEIILTSQETQSETVIQLENNFNIFAELSRSRLNNIRSIRNLSNGMIILSPRYMNFQRNSFQFLDIYLALHELIHPKPLRKGPRSPSSFGTTRSFSSVGPLPIPTIPQNQDNNTSNYETPISSRRRGSEYIEERSENNNINNLLVFLSQVHKISTLLPGSPDWQSLSTIPLPVRYVNCHGICSNGQFLFILCNDGILEIVPIFNSGTLQPSIQRNLGIKTDTHSMLLVSCGNLIITSERKNKII